MKRLRPAFIVTAMVSTACSNETTRNPPVPETIQRASASASASASAVADASATASANQTAGAPLRKRAGKRSKPAPRKETRGAFESLHPKDKDGRFIELADDDGCYVVVPKKGPPPKDMNTGERWTENVPVDCPPAFDDPAWDSARAGDSLSWDPSTGRCAFVPGLGNPPPPPVEAACPKQLPKTK